MTFSFNGRLTQQIRLCFPNSKSTGFLQKGVQCGYQTGSFRILKVMQSQLFQTMSTVQPTASYDNAIDHVNTIYTLR